ncbi:MAG: porin [Sphingobacteriaceae bacterium]|nr:MAG: porin [Sphingobacteriaceae bacterium]
MDMIDTTEAGKGLSVYRKYDHLKFSGYIQPQFQLAQDEGIKTYEGGVDFGNRVSNRFILRRSRIRLDYVHFKGEEGPGVQFVFQFDVNERRVTVRDVWGRVFENKFKLFSLTTGIFARPFGYETNLSSSDRESPERGRMNQALMRSERDLGAMVSFDSRRKKHPLNHLKIDFGVFNGQGINAEGEFDNTKDMIGRISLKPLKLNKAVTLSAGGSILYGGLENNTRYHYKTGESGGVKMQLVDSAMDNIGEVSPRKYYGADAQLKIANGKKMFTELRGEFITGTQTGSGNSNETPAALLTGSDGFYARKFNGAYFYFLQHIFSPDHQLLVKYDWLDPNSGVKGKDIGAAGSNFSAADIKYNTLGVGYVYYITPNVKSMLYYAMVKNETTNLAGFTKDVRDNVLTVRLQFRF